MTVAEMKTMESIQSINQKIPNIELRDLFAMNAIIGFHRGSLWTSGNYERVADECYKLADAMIKRREQH